MFSKIKNFFGRGKADKNVRPPKGSQAKIGGGKATKLVAQSLDDAPAGKTAARVQAVKPVDAKTYKQVRELRLSLARARSQLAGGDGSQIRTVRAYRRDLAQANARLRQSR